MEEAANWSQPNPRPPCNTAKAEMPELNTNVAAAARGGGTQVTGFKLGAPDGEDIGGKATLGAVPNSGEESGK